MPPASFLKNSSESLRNQMETSRAISRSLHILPSLEEQFPAVQDAPQGTAHGPVSDIMKLQPLDSYGVENNDFSWNEIEKFLDMPMNIPAGQNGQVEASVDVTASEDQTKKTNWQEWANELITVADDALDSTWSDLLVDVNVPDSGPELVNLPPDLSACQPQIQHPNQPQIQQPNQPQIQQPNQLQIQQPNQPQIQQPNQCRVPIGNSCQEIASPTAPSNKARMRWTPELHEVFVDAVNKLGGGEKATPKGVLKLMNVEGLTIYHVKSHLQKYRTARFKPEPSEGTSEPKSNDATDTTPLDLKTTMGLTQALRLQMEVQKQLHEQLEIQRNLQLQIEEQGKYLQMMFEQQRKMEEGKLKAPSPSSEPQIPPHSPSDKPEPSNKLDQSTISAENNPSNQETAPQMKPSSHPARDDSIPSLPPSKRAKVTSETSQES